MPVSDQRDPGQVRLALEAWLGRQMPNASAIEITELVVPAATGFSNETFLMDVRWVEPAGPVEAELVLRSQPQTTALFPEIDIISQQYRTMTQLAAHTDIPVPRTRWAESGPDVLGQPFFVMDRVKGDVPGDSPPYTVEGFVMDMTPEQRRTWHHNAITAMARVGAVDWRAAGLDYLDKPHHGRLGAEQRRNYFDLFLRWACRGLPHPVADPAWDWLLAHWPQDDDLVELSWGDARPGNQMFRDLDVVGIFDWEMVSLGNSESDLGWWLFLQRYHTEGSGVPLPEGMLDRDQTIARWEEVRARPAQHVDFYEVLGGFHFTLVMVKLAEMMSRFAPELADADMAVYNPVASITAELIGIDPPVRPA